MLLKFIELCISILGRVISHYLILWIDQMPSIRTRKQEQSNSKDDK